MSRKGMLPLAHSPQQGRPAARRAELPRPAVRRRAAGTCPERRSGAQPLRLRPARHRHPGPPAPAAGARALHRPARSALGQHECADGRRCGGAALRRRRRRAGASFSSTSSAVISTTAPSYMPRRTVAAGLAESRRVAEPRLATRRLG